MNNEVGIIIVTYNPDIREFTKTLDSCRFQCDMVAIVDNSEEDSIQSNLKKGVEHLENVKLVQMMTNTGIAKAQNVGIGLLADSGIDYFIEMDQDSLLPENYVSEMLESYWYLQRQGIKLCGIGPIAIDDRSDKPYVRYPGRSNFVEVDRTLSSGFMSSIDTFRSVGAKDEGLFIDLVDWEWSFRAKSLGFRTYVDTHLKMRHMLGEGRRAFLFLSLGVPQPLRHYYQFRNTILLARRGYVPLQWKMGNVCKLAFKLVAYPLLLGSGRERLSYMLLGLRDGLKGRTGAMNGR